MYLLRSLVGLAFAFCSLASALPAENEERSVEERAVCNHDNVLRALLHSSAVASPFCSSFLNIPSATAYAPGITPNPTVTTETVTIQVTAYPTQYFRYIIPQYLFPYPTPSRISSACSCLSVPTSTTTYTTTPTFVQKTITTTVPLTGACATETPIPGAYSASSPATSPPAFLFNIDGTSPDVISCCSTCNAFNPFPNEQGGRVQGFFGNCLAWWTTASGSCTFLLQGQEGAGYLGPLCGAYGFQPSVLYVDPDGEPLAAGGMGQCASTFKVVTT